MINGRSRGERGHASCETTIASAPADERGTP